MASLRQRLDGQIEPGGPTWKSASKADRRWFYDEAGTVALEQLRSQLSRGIGSDGRKMIPRKRLILPDGASGPVMSPHEDLSRAITLSDYMATDRSLTMFWQAGTGHKSYKAAKKRTAKTGKKALKFGEILWEHSEGNVRGAPARDVRLSAASIRAVKKTMALKWSARQREVKKKAALKGPTKAVAPPRQAPLKKLPATAKGFIVVETRAFKTSLPPRKPPPELPKVPETPKAPKVPDAGVEMKARAEAARLAKAEAARLKAQEALQARLKAEADERARMAERDRQEALQARLKAEAEAEARRQAEEAARLKAAEDARKKAAYEAERRRLAEAKAAEDARKKAAYEAERRRLAEAKAAEDARKKAAYEAERRRLAEAKAAEEARHAALRAKLEAEKAKPAAAGPSLTFADFRKAVTALGPDAKPSQKNAALLDLVRGRVSTTTTSKRVHGMTDPEDFRSFEIEGIHWHFTDPEGDLSSLVPQLRVLANGYPIPRSVAEATKNVYLTGQKNYSDAHWEQVYNTPDFVSAATGGDGDVTVYNGKPISNGDLVHEMGHNFATATYGGTHPSTGSRYRNAMATAEPPVSDYAKNSPAEDFAEAVRVYVELPLTMQTKYPNRHAALEEMIHD